MARPRKQSTAPKAGLPVKPAGLSALAGIEWDRLISEIERSGIQVTPAHRGLITAAATIAADIKTDWAELEREGQYHNSPKGGIMAHPALKRMDALRRDYIKVMSAIGLRPGVNSEPDKGTSLADVLNG
jgi:phage terminase small subunit